MAKKATVKGKLSSGDKSKINAVRLEKLNPERFIYENYESNWWSLLDINFVDSMEVDVIKNCISKYAVGYCDGSRLSVRPDSKTYAVMFEKDGYRFWFHIGKWWFNDME